MSLSVQPGQTIADKYRITKVIGQGGMGFVMAAQHMQLHRQVAIKFLHGDSDPQMLARFSREARIAGKLHSEHVCRVFDVGSLPSGEPFMVMEFLRGQDLKQLVGQAGPLPLQQAVDYLLQACEALSEAHMLGVVHRDLKPGNLFVTRRPDNSECLKVLDFGISKLRDAQSDMATDLTANGAILGSPRFISPEQLRSTSDVDLRTDIWALGAVLQELLTGKAAFAATTMGELCFMILSDDPTPVSELRPDLPAGVQTILNRCMAKEVDDRYANTAELALALKRFGSAGAAISVNRCKAIYEADGWEAPASQILPVGDAAPTNDSAPQQQAEAAAIDNEPIGEGSIVDGRFELMEVLGRGGMGVVWRAKQLSLDALCAVKLIAVKGQADDLSARFQREAQVAARLRTPHVMQVIDYGVWREHAFIAMELLEGETLRERLDRVGKLAPAKVLTIAAQLSHALTQAHAAEIVHRDLKPDNIFLAEGGQGDLVKVFDFGVAKDRTIASANQQQTASGVLLGTPRYMSPEQLDGLSSLDHRADIWSMGIMIYECLVGRQPFDAVKFSGLVQQIVAAPLPVPSEHAELPPAFDGWFARAAAREKEQRFASVAEMVDALTAALALTDGAQTVQVNATAPPVGAGTAVEDAGASASLQPAPGDSTVGELSVSEEGAPELPLRNGWRWGMVGIGVVAVFALAWGVFLRGDRTAERSQLVNPTGPADSDGADTTTRATTAGAATAAASQLAAPKPASIASTRTVETASSALPQRAGANAAQVGAGNPAGESTSSAAAQSGVTVAQPTAQPRGKPAGANTASNKNGDAPLETDHGF